MVLVNNLETLTRFKWFCNSLVELRAKFLGSSVYEGPIGIKSVLITRANRVIFPPSYGLVETEYFPSSHNEFYYSIVVLFMPITTEFLPWWSK